MEAAGVAMKSVTQAEDGQCSDSEHEVMRPRVDESLCKDQELPPAPTEVKPISPISKFDDLRITSSNPGTDKNFVGNDGTDIELPLRCRGGYNLDFLEEGGAEAVNLCPTSPLVVKERRRSVEVVHQNLEDQEVSECHESLSDDIHLERFPEASNKDESVLDISPSSTDDPLSSKGYNIDFLTAEGLNAKDLDPNLVGKEGGLQNSPPTGVTEAKGRKLVKPWMRKKAQKTPLPVRKEEEVIAAMEPEVKEPSPLKQEKIFLQADERCYVQDPNEVLEVQAGEEVELLMKPRLMKK